MSTSNFQPHPVIRHRGFFDYSKLLQAIRGWFVADDFDIIQIPLHKQKSISPLGVDHDFKIKCSKKVTEYVRFEIEVYVRIFNMRDVEIIQDGNKVKLQDAQLLIDIAPVLILDWQNRFKGTGFFKPFFQALDEFYRKYIIKYKIGDYWDDMLMLKAGQLARVIKEALGQEVM